MDFKTKDELLEQISSAVEQIQKQYRQGHDVIRDSEETFFLCQCVDEILYHGLKEGLISWTTEPSIWPLLEKITCTEDIEEINKLGLKNDKEKCTAWIRMAVNLNLLGSYVSTLQQDKSLLSNHYYDHAFLRDVVLADTVKSLLNYGIANFDFQITVDQGRMPKFSNDSRKHETHIEYDSYGKESNVNGNEFDRTASTIVRNESSSKKKRKKKKQSVNTAVITDIDNSSDGDLPNGDIIDSQKETEQNFSEIHNGNGESDNSDGPLKQLDVEDLNRATTVTSEAAVNGSPVDKRGDIEKYEHERQVTVPNENSGRKTDLVNGEDKLTEQTEKLVISEEEDRQTETLFPGNSEIEQYMLAQSLANKTKGPDAINTERHGENVRSSIDSKTDSCERKSRSSTPRNEFSTNDFLLENSTLLDDSGASNVEIESSYSKSGTAHLPPQTSSDSKNKENFAETDTCRAQDSGNLRKSEKNDSSEDSGGDKCSSTREDSVENDYKQIAHKLNYRVKKMENPVFVSSSYGSSYSDATDMSYDERDLNFIPGIHTHKTSSSYKSNSSYDRKNTLDSSVSFDENGLPVFDTSHFTESSSQTSSVDEASGRFMENSSEWDLFDDLLNMEEEHFSGPESFGGLSTTEELEIAIDHYKRLIKIKQDKSMDGNALVQKLIKLRLRLQQERDGPLVVNPKIRKVVSHHFCKEQNSSGGKLFCDHCGKIIWVIWQPMYTCKDCGYHSHKKCLEHIQRPCPVKNLSSQSYILDICPDTGLDAQQYRCAECRKAIAVSRDSVSEARMCDYSGQYFCDQCHWNDQVCIPARVVHNWDFSQYKVCRQTKQLLDLMKTRPLLNLQQINPMLFRYVEELREVGKLREDILVMKKYFLTCREALESKLLIQLQKRQHFVDNSDMYSFQDILDLNNDVLLPEISKIHALFLAHIKADCQLCRARGFICEVCQNSSDVIFAFDPHAVRCANCSAVFHKICFKPEDCPKCRRKNRIAEKT